MYLTEEEIETCQFLIDDRDPGEYEIKDIFGEYYAAITSPKDFGKRFKQSVENGHLKNISLGRLDLNDKHWRYILHGQGYRPEA
jgi:hypothetical protein